MATVNRVIELIGNLSGGDAELLRQLQSELTKAQDTLMHNVQNFDAILSSLNPAQHALGYLHILSVWAVTDADPVAFLNHTTRFLLACSPLQIRIDPKKFRLVCQKYTEIAVKNGVPHRVVKPLKTSIWKIAGEGSDHLTPQHSFFALACLKARAYKYSQSIIDHFVFEIDPDRTGIESEHTRLYFYYAGMLYLGLKQFAKAYEFFELVISAPALVGSAIMVAAYKKYLLASLIVRGEGPSPPKYTNPSLIRLFKQFCAPYEEFATSFSTRSVEDLVKVLNNNGAKFDEDGNLGLARQAYQALFDQNVQRLTKTYITLSLTDIAAKVHLADAAEAERRVLKMIEEGKVFASINQKDGMVLFKDAPEDYNPQTLEAQIVSAIKLNSSVERSDEALSLSQRYLQKLLQAERAPVRVDQMDVGGPSTPELGDFKG